MNKMRISEDLPPSLLISFEWRRWRSGRPRAWSSFAVRARWEPRGLAAWYLVAAGNPRGLDQWISELSFGTALKITSAPLREPRCDGCKL